MHGLTPNAGGGCESQTAEFYEDVIEAAREIVAKLGSFVARIFLLETRKRN